MNRNAGKIKSYTAKKARSHLPNRRPTDNKTHGGKTLIVAGSRGMWGAAILCARASARIGAGYTYISDTHKKFPSLKNPDFLISDKVKNFKKYNAIALGPGYKNKKELQKIIKTLIAEKHTRVVLDAEAINVLAELKTLPKLPASWILTPHEGELSRLLNLPSQLIHENRLHYLQQIQKELGCIILLKGHKTIISNGTNTWRLKVGNAALAKAGTGDVLTGIIAGLLSQNLSPLNAACCGAYIHGFTADLWIKNNDVVSLMASDLIELLPKSLKKLRN